jgi:DNA-binding CsgD family transcriptional regulator
VPRSVGLVGRESERQVLDEQLAAARSGNPQIVFVEGEAGSGKSSLLAHFLRSLSNATVLEASADESETLLTYGVVDQLRSDTPPEAETDPMAVGAQLLDLLDQLQSDGQVIVLVIDDLQWADRPSSRAVLFALRRLRADRVLTIISTRLGLPLDPGWTRLAGGDARVTRIRLTGLAPDNLIELASRLGLGTLSRRGAARLVAHTDGNALYCRALLDELGVGRLNAAGERGLPAPRELSGLILARVASLSQTTQTFLAAASVLGQHALVAAIASVAQLPNAQLEVDAAVGSGLLNEGSSISDLAFAHPLFRAAIYDDLSPTHRRELHARAAEVVVGRARLSHLVEASLGPDEALADEVEAIALADAAAGEAGSAAWALEQASSLSASLAEKERRLLDAAVILLNSADTAGASRILALCQSDGPRHDALAGLIGVLTGSPSTEDRLLAAWANHDPVADPEIGSRAATSLTNWMVISGRPDQALLWGNRAVASSISGSPVWAMAKTAYAYGFAAAGRSAEGIAELGFLPEVGGEVSILETDALIMRGTLRLFIDDLPGSIADLGVAASRLRTGVPSSYPVPCLVHLSDAYFRRGDWDAALTQAQLATSLAQDADRPLDLARAHARAGQVLGCRGQWDAAGSQVSAARAASDRLPQVLAIAAAAVAAVALADAREDDLDVLASAERVRATGLLGVGGRPGIFNWRPTEADALIRLGRLDDARTALGEFEAAISPFGPSSATLMLARCQGSLAAAGGEGAAAADSFAHAHRIAASVPFPFERALLNLDDGRRLRSAGDRKQAIQRLEQAHHGFSELGADPYVKRCATELGALEVEAAEQSPAALLGLSRAEMAVARLVATGLTNKEAAAELYVSAKTVEYHLRNCYIKLDITSRRELTELLR